MMRMMTRMMGRNNNNKGNQKNREGAWRVEEDNRWSKSVLKSAIFELCQWVVVCVCVGIRRGGEIGSCFEMATVFWM